MSIMANKNQTVLIILRFPKWAVPLAFFAMALFRLPLMLNGKISFWRLMGSGKNGTFDTRPDLQQWAILLVLKQPIETFGGLTQVQDLLGRFITRYLHFCGAKFSGYFLQPIEGHGLWNGKKVFGELPRKTDYEGRIAIMTRATIRLLKLKQFWENVPAVATSMVAAPGFETSYGVGEIPWVKQATFSIWESRAQMVTFAYKQQAHRDVIKKTYDNNWYSEEMFTRFIVLSHF